MKHTPNEEFFKTFLHQCNDLVVITDKQANIVYVNPAFEKHTGYKAKSVYGKNISIVKSGLHKVTFYRNLWKRLQEGKPESRVFINKKKSGEFYYEHKTITPIKNTSNAITYYLSTSKDVTAELKLQQEVVKQKNFIQSVVQNTNALIIGVDSSFRINLFNSTCERLTGFTFKEIEGKHVFELLIPTKERKNVSSVFNNLIRNGKSVRNEYHLVTKTKNPLLVSWSHTVINDEKGRPQTILSTGIDVTRERDNENRLLQLNSSLDQKIKLKTKALYELNKKILLQNKFARKVNSEIPALVYLIDLENKTIRLFNNKLNKKITLPEKKDKDISINHFLKYIKNEDDVDYRKLFLTAPNQDLELPFVINDKHYCFQNRSVVFEKQKDGKVLKILGFISDITKTKFIQRKLEESQKIAKIGTWEWDISDDSLYWSDEIFRIFEKDPASFKPSYKKFLQHIHPEEKGAVIEAVNRSLIERTPYEIVHRLRLPNNKTKYVREKGYTQYAEDGKPIRMIGTVQDVTDEKKLKTQLRSAYVTLQNSLNAIVTTDINGFITFANNAAVKMLGFPDAESMIADKLSVYKLWAPWHHTQINEIKEQVRENGYYFSESPFTSLKNNGNELLLKFNASLIRGGDKKPVAFTWCFFDVTEQIKTEKKVKEYDTKINLLLGNIDEVVFGLDAHKGSYTAGKLFYLSAKSTEIMGFDLKDLRNEMTPWCARIHADDLSKYFQSNLECISGRNTVTRTYRLLHGIKKRYRWYEETVSPYYDNDGELRSFYGSVRDVTERIEAEIRLKESEMQYRSIFENALVGIFRADLKSLTAIDANEVCIKLFGYDSKTDFLAHFNAAAHLDGTSRHNDLYQDLKVNSSIMNRKMKFKRRDGSTFWGDASVQYLKDQDIIEGVVLDVTKNHEYEFQLKKNLTEKEILLKEVHHRVKNNLQVISSLLKLQVNKLTDPKLRQVLIESYERIHAIALIHEKLYLGDDVSTINFSDYLANLAKSMLSLHKDKKVRLNVSAVPFCTEIGVAIPLGLICYEIISNSFKHAFCLNKEYDLVFSVLSGENGENEITISDTGKGFDTQILANTNTLGWKLISNLARQAKVNVDVTSEINSGTTFKIRTA